MSSLHSSTSGVLDSVRHLKIGRDYHCHMFRALTNVSYPSIFTSYHRLNRFTRYETQIYAKKTAKNEHNGVRSNIWTICALSSFISSFTVGLSHILDNDDGLHRQQVECIRYQIYSLLHALITLAKTLLCTE